MPRLVHAFGTDLVGCIHSAACNISKCYPEQQRVGFGEAPDQYVLVVVVVAGVDLDSARRQGREKRLRVGELPVQPLGLQCLRGAQQNHRLLYVCADAAASMLAAALSCTLHLSRETWLPLFRLIPFFPEDRQNGEAPNGLAIVDLFKACGGCVSGCRSTPLALNSSCRRSTALRSQ